MTNSSKVTVTDIKIHPKQTKALCRKVYQAKDCKVNITISSIQHPNREMQRTITHLKAQRFTKKEKTEMKLDYASDRSSAKKSKRLQINFRYLSLCKQLSLRKRRERQRKRKRRHIFIKKICILFSRLEFYLRGCSFGREEIFRWLLSSSCCKRGNDIFLSPHRPTATSSRLLPCHAHPCTHNTLPLNDFNILM